MSYITDSSYPEKLVKVLFGKINLPKMMFFQEFSYGK